MNNIILWMTVCVFGNRIHNYDNHRVHSVPTKHFSNPNDVPDSLERDHQMKHFVAHKQSKFSLVCLSHMYSQSS